MKIILTLFLIILHFPSFAAKQEKSEHLRTILKTLAPHLQGSSELRGFKTKGCSVQKEKWAMLLITQQTFKENVRFNKNCDLSGSFSPFINKFFPVDFILRGLKNVTRLKGLMRISIVFGEVTKLKLELDKASYSDSKNTLQKEFKLDYTFEIDPFSPENFLKKDLGGSITLLKNGKKLKKITLD